MINILGTQVLRHSLLHTTYSEILKLTVNIQLYSKAGLHAMKHTNLLIPGLLTFNYSMNVIMNWNGCGRKGPWHLSGAIATLSQEGLRKTKNLGQDSWS
jgi:hypothetical protein